MTFMSGYRNRKICALTLLLLMFGAACSDYDKSGSNRTVTAPTVVSVVPLNAAASACPNTTVTATFGRHFRNGEWSGRKVSWSHSAFPMPTSRPNLSGNKKILPTLK